MVAKIIPTPKKMMLHGGKTLVTGVSCQVSKWQKQISAFRQIMEGFVGKKYGEGNIICACDPSVEGGGYIIKAELTAVTVLASDAKGICCGLAAVAQLAAANGGYVPCCTVADMPDCTYRGMMVDLARTWHPFDYLLRYVDLCWYYRMTTLHLHFTDSQSYTLPSAEFSKLPSVNRYYTSEQIAYLAEYAEARGVELMPEIDVPGHSDPFAANYPEIFGDKGIIGFTEEVFGAFDKLLTELCAMFPYSKHIHIGGDEAAIGRWLEVPEYSAYADSLGLIKGDPLDSERIYATFVQRLADIIFKNGRTPIVWEGFAKGVNDLVSRDVLVMSWENFYQTTPDLLEGGFTLINCSWNPMYVVAPNTFWKQSEVYDWDIFRFKPVHGGSPYIHTGVVVEPTDMMIGGQLLAWGDRLPADKASLDNELNLLAERLPCVAQNTWNKRKVMDYDEFAAIYKTVSKPIMG